MYCKKNHAKLYTKNLCGCEGELHYSKGPLYYHGKFINIKVDTKIKT